MNGIKYLLDTNIIIGMYHKNSEVKAILRNKRVVIQQCAYSAVTRMELLGFPDITNFEKQSINALLNRMLRLSISQEIEEATITFKQRYRVKLPDAIIAATAITHNLELLTLDKKLGSKL